MNSGKILALSLLMLGLAAAGIAWWHNAQKGRAALDFWGGEVAYQIRTAASVELWQFSTAADAELAPASSQEAFGGQVFIVDHKIDISTAAGLVHARQALISDPSYDWEAATESAQPKWAFALRFAADDEPYFVLLDLDGDWAADGDDPTRLVKMKIGPGLRKFLEERVKIAESLPTA